VHDTGTHHTVNVLREERLPIFMVNGWPAVHERLFLSVLSAVLNIDASAPPRSLLLAHSHLEHAGTINWGRLAAPLVRWCSIFARARSRR
jgi:hypothetical protein